MGIIWREHRGMAISLAFVFLVNSIAPFVASGLWGLLLNKLGVLGTLGLSRELIVILVLLLVSRAIIPILQNLQSYYSWTFGYWLDEKFEMSLLQKRAELDVATHEDPKLNDLFNRVNENGAWRVRQFVDRQFYLFQNIIEVVVASIIILSFKWWVFLIIAIGTIPELMGELKYGRHVWGIEFAKAEVKRRYWDSRDHFYHLNKLIELKLFQNIKYFIDSIQKLFLSFRSEERKNEWERLKGRTLSVTVSQLVYAFATIWFVVAVVKGQMLIGSLV
ncbi:MAG TPA: hypothetical protein VJG48_03185, partial [Candidatus Paceibacterota bacterium]